MKAADPALIREIAAKLAAEFDPQEIVLFGSHAWGKPTEDSDLDLLVIVRDSQERPAQRARRAYRCLRGVKAPLDVLVRTRGEVARHRNVRASLVSRALDDGIVLYGRGDATGRVFNLEPPQQPDCPIVGCEIAQHPDHATVIRRIIPI